MLWHSRSLFLEKRDAWRTQYFGPPKHFECVVGAHPERSVGVHFLRVYAPAEPRTMVTTIMQSERNKVHVYVYIYIYIYIYIHIYVNARVVMT